MSAFATVEARAIRHGSKKHFCIRKVAAFRYLAAKPITKPRYWEDAMSSPTTATHNILLPLTRKQFLGAATAGLMAPTIWRSDRAWAQGTVILKLAHPDTNLHPIQQVATQFAEMVSKKTNGAVNIQVYAGGQLGSEVNIVSGMTTGIVDMAFHTTGFLESFFPRIQVLDLPFLFKTLRPPNTGSTVRLDKAYLAICRQGESMASSGATTVGARPKPTLIRSASRPT
jgi:hypothetical protein